MTRIQDVRTTGGGLEIRGYVCYPASEMSRLELALRLIGMGWYVGISILLGVLAGIWLDNKLHTTPWLVIIGLLLGITVAFYGVYKMLLPNINQKKSKGNK